MLALTKLTEEWFKKGGFRVGILPYSLLHLWESEVLLPWLKEHEEKKCKDRVDSFEVNGQLFWGIEKRKEQAEWLKNNLFTNFSQDTTTTQQKVFKNIDQAFGFNSDYYICHKCGHKHLKEKVND
jgi:hypothetical protein